MKNILILADGSIAKHFVKWIGKRRISENKYHVAFFRQEFLSEKLDRSVTGHFCDPTSYVKLLKLLSSVKFYKIFIVLDDEDDTIFALKNIRKIDNKIFVVLLDRWGSSHESNHNLTILNQNQLMAVHLHDHLPNVPVVAQNVGLGEGEIMEMIVPFGSSYAYRHVGSISQRKWKIAAIYRDKKQIIPTNATMIRPNDILLTLGKPLILIGVYKSINRRQGLFPEPFGKNLYLFLDMEYDEVKSLNFFYESIYLLDKLENKHLHVRIINPSAFSYIHALKAEARNNITIHIYYDQTHINELIEYDIQTFDIGLALCSKTSFNNHHLKSQLYNLKKLVYLFGDTSLNTITDSVVLLTSENEMESISSTVFDFTESFKLKLRLFNFDPEGDFDNKKRIVEHFETLSQIFNYDINITHEISNPVRRLATMENILQITPYHIKMAKKSLFTILSTRVQDYLLTIKRHPKLLVPIESMDS